MTAVVYLYDDDGNLVKKNAVPPTDVRYSSSGGILIEKTEYVFSHYRLLNTEEIKK